MSPAARPLPGNCMRKPESAPGRKPSCCWSLTGGKRLFLTSTSSAAHCRSRTLCSSRGRPATPNGSPWMRSGRWPGPVFWPRPLLAASASRRPGWSGWWKRMRRSRSRSAPYFSVQNSTCLPSRIRLVVRTAHILPHMEQVCRSAGGVLSK